MGQLHEPKSGRRHLWRVHDIMSVGLWRLQEATWCVRLWKQWLSQCRRDFATWSFSKYSWRIVRNIEDRDQPLYTKNSAYLEIESPSRVRLNMDFTAADLWLLGAEEIFSSSLSRQNQYYGKILIFVATKLGASVMRRVASFVDIRFLPLWDILQWWLTI